MCSAVMESLTRAATVTKGGEAQQTVWMKKNAREPSFSHKKTQSGGVC